MGILTRRSGSWTALEKPLITNRDLTAGSLRGSPRTPLHEYKPSHALPRLKRLCPIAAYGACIWVDDWGLSAWPDRLCRGIYLVL